MDAHPQTEAVEHRHGGQHLGVVHFFIGHVDGLPGQGIEVEVAEHYALGGACSAAREQYNRFGAVVLLCNVAVANAFAHLHEIAPQYVVRSINLGELALGEELLCHGEGEGEFVGHAADYEFADGALLLHTEELAVELVQGHGYAAVRLVHVECQFRHGRQRMHHGRDGAYAVEAVEAEHSLRHVRKADQNPLAGPHPQCMEAAGHTVDFLRKPGVRCGLAHEGEGRKFLFHGGGVQNRTGYRFFAVIQVGGYLPIAFKPRGGYIVEFVFHCWFSRFRSGLPPVRPAARGSGRSCAPGGAFSQNNSRPRCARRW